MDGCLINLQNLLPIAGIFSLLIIGLSYFFYHLGHKAKEEKKLPAWWEKTFYSFLVLFICVSLLSYKWITSKKNTALFLNKAQIAKLLEIEGLANIAQMHIEIDQKLRELDSRKDKKIPSPTDLFLLQENLLKIIQANRERLIELNVKLPNGELLGEVLKKTYSEKEFHDNFVKISSEVLKPGISHRERMKAVDAFIKRKQLDLLERVIHEYFEK